MTIKPTALLAFSDGTTFRGHGFGARAMVTGELVFNTAMTGYQEVLTDPSYASQIITFTFPHIGNVGANDEDCESLSPFALGAVVRESITAPSNWRSAGALGAFLETHGLPGISGIDTRELTAKLREHGSANVTLCHEPSGDIDVEKAIAQAQAFAGLEGMDLALQVTGRQRREWTEGVWQWPDGFREGSGDGPHIAVIDYGVKRNILRSLAARGCRLTVFPANVSADDVLSVGPDGIFLSNGPGDPMATGEYAVPEIRRLLEHNIPVFGICLGHQLLSLALGARTEKMPFGHHGANHPVQDLTTGKVEITSQNHGFTIIPDSLGDEIMVTHKSLFDETIEGIALRDRPVFSVQYHPEASPGPRDSAYLFDRFLDNIKQAG